MKQFTEIVPVERNKINQNQYTVLYVILTDKLIELESFPFIIKHEIMYTDKFFKNTLGMNVEYSIIQTKS